MVANQTAISSIMPTLVESASISDPLGSAVQLMRGSWLHRRWTVADIERLILPPIELDQCLFAKLGTSTTGFVSWALLSHEASQAFIHRERPLLSPDWHSGDNLWIIDFICNAGEGSSIANVVLRYLRIRYPNQKSAQAIRYKRTGVQRRHVRWSMVHL